MKKYVGTKVLEAKQLNRGDYNKYRGWKIPENENPQDEGYLVKYKDGYESWSPKKQFDAAYREYNNNTLPATAVMMNSADYKERFIAEYKQTKIRYDGLRSMVDKWDKGELNFKPTCPRSLYDLQLRSMWEYLVVLESRATIEEIEL